MKTGIQNTNQIAHPSILKDTPMILKIRVHTTCHNQLNARNGNAKISNITLIVPSALYRLSKRLILES